MWFFDPDREFPTRPVFGLCFRRLPSRRTVPCSRPDCFPSHCLPNYSHPIPTFANNFSHNIPFTTGFLVSPSYGYGCNRIALYATLDEIEVLLLLYEEIRLETRDPSYVL